MRYVDTGSRDPEHTLGAWLAGVVGAQHPVAALRIMTGYFGTAAMGYFEDVLQTLSDQDGPTHIVVGSNDGHTPRAAVSDLLRLVGPPRPGLRTGIVSFQDGLFHPKVFHVERSDGSSTAYVGSANLTMPGATGLNIEAAIILDSQQGDPPPVLADIARAVDEWFSAQRPGMYPVSVETDLDLLVQAGIFNVPAPPRPPRQVQPANTGSQGQQQAHSLRPLITMPAITLTLTPATGAVGQGPTGQTPVPAPAPVPAAVQPVYAVKRWYKKLDRSNAQRLGGTSNATGHLTLTGGPAIPGVPRHPINFRTYFRQEFFGAEVWQPIAGAGRDHTYVPVHVVVNGRPPATYDLEVDHNPMFESGQGNRSTILHWGPLSDYLRTQVNHDGDVVTLEKLSDGTYRLSLAATPTGPFIA